MSRQRLRESNVKWKVSLTNESFSLKVLKIVETNSVLNKAKHVELRICEKLSNFMKENFLEDLKYFETKNKIKIDIIFDNSLVIPEYKIDFKNKGNNRANEKAPPGREKQVKALKGKVDNPYAVAWASYNKSKNKTWSNWFGNGMWSYWFSNWISSFSRWLFESLYS